MITRLESLSVKQHKIMIAEQNKEITTKNWQMTNDIARQKLKNPPPLLATASGIRKCQLNRLRIEHIKPRDMLSDSSDFELNTMNTLKKSIPLHPFETHSIYPW